MNGNVFAVVIFFISALVAFCAESDVLLKNGALPSFRYNGSEFDALKWTIGENPLSNNADFSVLERTIDSPDGLLRIRQKIIKYKKYDFTEWKTSIENIGDKSSGIVEDFMPFNLSIPRERKKIRLEGVKIRRMRGSDWSTTDFVPDDFLMETRPDADSLLMKNVRGYSSEEWMPYFGIDFDALNGLNVAIGWSGNWKAYFRLDPPKFFAKAGMIKTCFFLKKSESVIQPSILVMRRNNISVIDAQNVWRKFILEYKTPKKADGSPFITPIQTSCGGYASDDFVLDALSGAKKGNFGFEMFGIDAGWFGGPHNPKIKNQFGDWMSRGGDWRMNTNIHPQGLSKISNAARDAGMIFSLWCDIERVMANAPICKERPDFIISKIGKNPGGYFLLNLANPEAWKYALDTLSALFEKEKVDVWRVDTVVNIEMNSAWANEDSKEPYRIGITEAKYIGGFYALWDSLKKRFPNMQFDNCAGGGRRLDYEFLSRTFIIWRSDVQCNNFDIVGELSQIQTNYLCSWLPSHSGGNGAKIDDEYKYYSSFSSGMMVPAGSLSDVKCADRIRKYVADAKRIRKYILRDFYPLIDKPENLENWCAYQGHSASENAGFAIAFRRKQSPWDTQMLHLYRIDKNAIYEVENRRGEKKKISGTELSNYCVSLPPRDFELIFYRKITSAPF